MEQIVADSILRVNLEMNFVTHSRIRNIAGCSVMMGSAVLFRLLNHWNQHNKTICSKDSVTESFSSLVFQTEVLLLLVNK